MGDLRAGTTTTAPRPRSLEERLDRLAMVALRVGVGFEHDDRLRLVGPLEAADLMRRITVQAYELGAAYVDVRYVDPHLSLARARYAREETLDGFPTEQADLAFTVAERGDASITVSGKDPDALASADPARVGRMNRAANRALRATSDLAMASHMPWTIVPFAVPAWARKVFPDASAAEAQARLWDAIFAATRVDADDPVVAWGAHATQLDALAERLSREGFEALHVRGPGTDLRVGLARGHVWEGASSVSGVDGRRFVANIPTEEVFTAPHAEHVEGTVRASRPLSYGGQVVDGFSFTFEGGTVVDYAAERGASVLRALLETDTGARRLGEVALVPHSSPIGAAGRLFYDTLFDENAASHLALGRGYPTTLRDGAARSSDERSHAGLNDSLVHVDFMIGSAEMDVVGLLADGDAVDVMRRGEWVLGGL